MSKRDRELEKLIEQQAKEMRREEKTYRFKACNKRGGSGLGIH